MRDLNLFKKCYNAFVERRFVMSHNRRKKEFLNNGSGESYLNSFAKGQGADPFEKNFHIPSSKTKEEFHKFLQELKNFPPFSDG